MFRHKPPAVLAFLVMFADLYDRGIEPENYQAVYARFAEAADFNASRSYFHTLVSNVFYPYVVGCKKIPRNASLSLRMNFKDSMGGMKKDFCKFVAQGHEPLEAAKLAGYSEKSCPVVALRSMREKRVLDMIKEMQK